MRLYESPHIQEYGCSFFSGFKNKDVAFFHPESKVMVEADLLFNLPGNEQVPIFSELSASIDRIWC